MNLWESRTSKSTRLSRSRDQWHSTDFIDPARSETTDIWRPSTNII